MDSMMDMIKEEIGEKDIQNNRTTIIGLLRDTKREGIEKLINYMDKQGFFTAPCSTQYHLSKVGGLAEHSLNVYRILNDVAFQIDYSEQKCSEKSLIIVSLLHDLGKMGHHNKPNYIPTSLLKSGKVAAKPFETNKELLYVPHEIESIAIASRFIELTEQEEFAILMHNGMYSELKYSYSGKETPLSMLLHFADLWCSRVTEVENE